MGENSFSKLWANGSQPACTGSSLGSFSNLPMPGPQANWIRVSRVRPRKSVCMCLYTHTHTQRWFECANWIEKHWSEGMTLKLVPIQMWCWDLIILSEQGTYVHPCRGGCLQTLFFSDVTGTSYFRKELDLLFNKQCPLFQGKRKSWNWHPSR